MFVRVLGWVGLSFALVTLLACEPPSDSCVEVGRRPAVAFDEVGEPGFAAADSLAPAGRYRARDGGYDLEVTLDWSDRATPRRYRWVDGDDDGVVPEEACPMDYEVRGTISVDSGDGRYDERGSATTTANAGGGTHLWVTIDDDDVRGSEVPGQELWLEIWESEGELHFALTDIGLGSDADYRVDAVLEPLD